MRDYDLDYLHKAIETAQKAREHGNHPFGAVLVDAQGKFLLEAENSVNTGMDCTGHAETNLMRKASGQFSAEMLAGCTLYTSTEPCAMCSGAIFWGGISRVVYALSERGLYEMTIGPSYLNLPCREVFFRSGRTIEVLGPLLVEEARQVHEGFWK
ncbi:MAG: nucleoside deaminase [Anaerolineaceae bacterium]|nr:nucleoside deaminase [Anaerolineaceae bacterium]